jgi:hypothetical protein
MMAFSDEENTTPMGKIEMSSRTGADSNYRIRLPLQQVERLRAKPPNYSMD